MGLQHHLQKSMNNYALKLNYMELHMNVNKPDVNYLLTN